MPPETFADLWDTLKRGQFWLGVRAQAQESVTHAAKASASLDAILQGVARINDMNGHIAAAVEEQSAVAAEVSRNISNINVVAESNFSRGQCMAAASDGLLRMAMELNAVVRRFKG